MITLDPGITGEVGVFQNTIIMDEISYPAAITYGADGPIVELSDEAVKHVAKKSFQELSEYFGELTLYIDVDLEDFFPRVILFFPSDQNPEKKYVLLNMKPRLYNWTKPWNYIDYTVQFEQLLIEKNDDRFLVTTSHEDESIAFYDGILFPVKDHDASIESIIDVLVGVGRELHFETESFLTAHLNKGSLVTYFDFPPSVKVACEQYLQYFVQFLDDLGIEADSQISSKAGKVLFSVTPIDENQALENIQQALSAYLSMAKDGVNGDESNADIAVVQLKSNVLHLQSQLMLAQGMMQLNAATIRAQNETINAQNMQISLYQKNQIITHSESKSGPKQDSEELIPGYVSVTSVKGKGLVIDLPNIVRGLKRRWNGGAEKK